MEIALKTNVIVLFPEVFCMPAAITISKLSWSTPDGRPLFSDLDLTFGPGRTGLVGRNGVGKSRFSRSLPAHFHQATGRSLKGEDRVAPPDLRRRTGQTVADIFEVRRALDILARAERGEATAEEITEADWSLEDRIESALVSLGMSAKPDTPLSTLSGGEYTRVALAALVFAKPDFCCCWTNRQITSMARGAVSLNPF